MHLCCLLVSKDQINSRSTSRLANRSQTPNLSDINEADLNLDTDNRDLTLRPSKSWTNLLRAKSPVSVEQSRPLLGPTMHEFFSAPPTNSDDHDGHELTTSAQSSSQVEASLTVEQTEPLESFRKYSQDFMIADTTPVSYTHLTLPTKRIV